MTKLTTIAIKVEDKQKIAELRKTYNLKKNHELISKLISEIIAYKKQDINNEELISVEVVDNLEKKVNILQTDPLEKSMLSLKKHKIIE